MLSLTKPLKNLLKTNVHILEYEIQLLSLFKWSFHLGYLTHWQVMGKAEEVKKWLDQTWELELTHPKLIISHKTTLESSHKG